MNKVSKHAAEISGKASKRKKRRIGGYLQSPAIDGPSHQTF